MLRKTLALISGLLLLSACNQQQDIVIIPEAQDLTVTTVGQWITDDSGKVMFDPQTSGLVVLEGQLITIADASADITQQLKLHTINPSTFKLAHSSDRFSFSREVRRSCFFDYLNDQPDLEALAVDPRNPNVIYTVTEDATRTGALSTRCESKYEKTETTV